MLFKIAMRPAQVEAFYIWTDEASESAEILIDQRKDGTLVLGQGDTRAEISPDGKLTEVE